ncbi:GNAT family N-acetyltransferase [Niallia nealsonii]|nr:GNAT family N-acetyltransferase [Niallia nealsonii]
MGEAFKEYGKLEVPSSAITEPIEVLTENFKNGSEKFAVCLIEEVPIASVRFTEKSKTLYFSRLSVLPAYREQGIARYMLQWLENYAKQLGKNKMECKVRMSLAGNIRLYQAIGFHLVEEGKVINPNGHTVKTGVMEKVF